MCEDHPWFWGLCRESGTLYVGVSYGRRRWITSTSVVCVLVKASVVASGLGWPRLQNNGGRGASEGEWDDPGERRRVSPGSVEGSSGWRAVECSTRNFSQNRCGLSEISLWFRVAGF